LTGIAGTTVDSVVGHHMNPFRSGVARFNEILAERLGVPLVGLGELSDAAVRHPLVSLKIRELDAEGRTMLERLLERADGWSLFLHEFSDLPLEVRAAEGATRVWCGNHEILAAVAHLGDTAEVLWAPGLVSDLRTFEPASISVFSFGMAHKIRVDMFGRLRELLDATNRSYALYVSSANHETASIQDAELVYEEMHRIFPSGLYFLGNLSDVGVHNYLLTTTFFAAFFPGGVRANNTSVASAMEHGAIVITNLDEHSPPELAHLDNVIDLNQAEQLPTDPLELRRIAVRAMETGRARSWDALVARLTATGATLRS
jgi:hypothetical protein